MARQGIRRQFGLEALESREVLSSSGPSAQAQYMLELINEARTNPAQAAERVTHNPDANLRATLSYHQMNIDAVKREISAIAPQQPVAWNAELSGAATAHSQDMASKGFQSHTGSDGSSPSDRLDRAGYTNRQSDMENAYAYSESVDRAMQAFLIDWGVPGASHRTNMLQPGQSPDKAWSEVGIGIVDSNRSDVGPQVVTQNFARRNGAQPMLLGVAYDDSNGDNFYNPGEGRGDVTITARSLSDGRTQSVETWDAGGYQMPLAPGNYQVNARVNGQLVSSRSVNLSDQNVKIDYRLDELKPIAEAAPTPVATPTPTPRVVTEAPAIVVQVPVAVPVAVQVQVPVQVQAASTNFDRVEVPSELRQSNTNTIADSSPAETPSSFLDSNIVGRFVKWTVSRAKKA